MALIAVRHIINAARNLTSMDDKQVAAVSARIELDLRIGFAFTRFLTTNLRLLGGPLAEMMLSYGRGNRHPGVWA
jgi:DNA topoisomerase III